MPTTASSYRQCHTSTLLQLITWQDCWTRCWQGWRGGNGGAIDRSSFIGHPRWSRGKVQLTESNILQCFSFLLFSLLHGLIFRYALISKEFKLSHKQMKPKLQHETLRWTDLALGITFTKNLIKKWLRLWDSMFHHPGNNTRPNKTNRRGFHFSIPFELS